MHHEMLTQRALFCIDVMAKRVTLSQHFVMHVIPTQIALCTKPAWTTENKGLLVGIKLSLHSSN
jgi:hypothetical protein